MKITKAMGRACLKELETGMSYVLATEALREIGWADGRGTFFDWGSDYRTGRGQEETALAMCAAIAGVKP